MKKKLLLTGVAAMALLAVGVGATSTFAWYTASAAVSLKNDAASVSVSTTQTEASLTKYIVKFTITPQAEHPIELSNLVSSTAYFCAYSGAGVPSTTAITSENVARFRGTYSVTVTWAAQTAYDGETAKAEGQDPRSPAEKLAMKNTKYSFHVAGAGNVKMLSSTDTAAATEEASHEIKVVFDANGDITSACEDTSAGWYCVRTNNPDGLEYVHSGTTPAALKAAGQQIDTTGDLVSGVLYNGTSYEISKNSSATGKYMHDADALTIAENTTGVAKDNVG